MLWPQASLLRRARKSRLFRFALGGMVIIGMALAGLTAWLTVTPINLDVWLPRIEKALSDENNKRQASLEKLELAWEGGLVLRGGEGIMRWGDNHVAARQIHLELDPLALLSLRLMPSRVVLEGADIFLSLEEKIVRDNQPSSSSISEKTALVAFPSLLADLPEMSLRNSRLLVAHDQRVWPIQIFEGQLSASRPSSYTLTLSGQVDKFFPHWRINIALELDGDSDRFAGEAEILNRENNKLQLSSLSLLFDRKQRTLKGTSDLVLHHDSRQEPIQSGKASLSWEASPQKLGFAINSESLTTRQLATWLVESLSYLPASMRSFINALKMMDAPFTLRADIDRNQEKSKGRSLRANLALSAGRLHMPPDIIPEPLSFDEVWVQFGYKPSFGWHLREGRIVMGKSRLTFSGNLSSRDKSQHLTLTLAGQSIPMEIIHAIWPANQGRSRAWITERIHEGEITSINLDLGLHIDEKGVIDLNHLDGHGFYQDIAIEYIAGFPWVTKLGGSLTFDPNMITFNLEEGGHGKGIKLSAGTVRIAGLQASEQIADIDVSAHGHVPEILALIDHPPLAYASALKVKPSETKGFVRLDLDFIFPLEHELDLPDIQFTIKADINQARFPGFMGQDLNDVKGHIRIDEQGLDFRSTGRISGLPIKLVWQESFLSSQQQAQREMRVSARLDDAARSQLGLDKLVTQATGIVDVETIFRFDSLGNGSGRVNVDLSKISANLDYFNWHKPEGVKARLEADITLSQERLAEIAYFSLTAPDLLIQGRAKPLHDARLQGEIALKHFEIGNTQLGPISINLKEDHLVIKLEGKQLDLGSILDSKSAELKDQGDDAVLPSWPPWQGEPRHLRVQGQFAALRLGPERELSDITVLLSHDLLGWQSLKIDASLVDDKKLRLHFRRDDKPYALRIQGEDFGELLKLMGLKGGIQGGEIAVRASRKESDAPRLEGEIRILNYVLKEAPAFARLLSLVSLTGFIEMLSSSDGIDFLNFSTCFAADEQKIILSQGRAVSSSLGISFEGRLDLINETMDMIGTLSPAYSVSRVIGAIPLLGPLLAPEGEGILGVTFLAKGPYDTPEFQINPLSIITPGLLRGLLAQSVEGIDNADQLGDCGRGKASQAP